MQALRDQAISGSYRSAYQLGMLYELGRGVTKDNETAASWMEYANDEDGYTNYRKAYFWADIAAASSVSSKLQNMSAQLRDEAAKHLTPDELKIMQRKAEVYFDERQEGGSDLLYHGHKIPSEDRNHVGESRPSQKTPAFQAPPSAD